MKRKLVLAFAVVWTVMGIGSSPAHGQEELLDCFIEPKATVVLSAPMIGRVDEIMVDRGDLIEEEQVLATLESRLERATLELARARADSVGDLKTSKARNEFELRRKARGHELHSKNVISELELDEVESAQKVTEAQLLESREGRVLARLDMVRAQASLELRTIRSPIKGVVVRRIRQPREYADPPQILEIAQIDPLNVEVFAPVALLNRIEVGDEASVTPEDPVGGTYVGKVVVVDRVVDAASGTFGVRVELPNPDYALPAGLKCQVRFSH